MKRKNEEYHKTNIDIICDLLVKVVLPCIVIGIMLLITFTSHASGNESGFYFPMEQNENGNIPQYIIDYFNYNYSDDYYVLLRWWGHNSSFNEDYIYFIMFPKTNDFMVYGEISNNGYQFSLYNVGNNIGGLSNGYMGFRNGSQTDYWNGGQNLSGWQSLNSSLYDSGTDFVSNFKIWTSNNENNRSVVLKYGSEEPVIVTSHATPPDEFNSPVYTQGHSKPEHVPPTITVNNYTWTTYTPPTVDNSTLEKLLESLTDIVKYNANYLKDNLHNEFTNLVNNIKNLIDYIGQTIQYYGNLIIENIQNSITTFYNNMVSLFEPVAVAIDYISQPLQVEEVVTAIEDTQINSDITSVISLSNTAFGIFGTVSEPQSFTIPLDLTGIAILHQTQPFYIDLSWINSAKSYIRAFMWCIVTFGLLYSIIIGIPTMLKDSK